MNNLYDSFLTAVDSFIKLCKDTPSHLTIDASKNNIPNTDMLHAWESMIAKVQDKYYETEDLFKNENITKFSENLDFYRSLCRWLEKIPCTWSTLYSAIQQQLEVIGDKKAEIEEKYGLAD